MPLRPSKPKPKPNQLNWAFEAIGTQWQIDIYEPVADEPARELWLSIDKRINAFDMVYSRFQADSLVTRIAQSAGEYEFPADAAKLWELYRRTYELTDGNMTPLAGQLLVDAGYDAAYSLTPTTLRPVPAWDEVMTWQMPTLTTTKPLWLDFGAAGKGYLVDIVSELIMAAGYTAYCVDAGGDMRHQQSEATLQVGLEHPFDAALAVGIVELGTFSLCGSAGNRRAWSTFHHVISPQTSQSPQHIVAVWVTAATTAVADAMTTALYFAPAASLQREFEFEYALITPAGHIEQSAHFPGTFFTAGNV